MTDSVIQVENLGKRYRLGASGGVRALLGRGEAFDALRDVTFDVKRGEVMGLVGHNGAGKSTLLKVLAQITNPTSGRAIVRGRVGSLLEVGTGFHPELSGRENIYLNGAILGMSRREIKAKFDAIVSFAEVDAFLDTPVKRYSSGMRVRLAFAVAAHLTPEVLLIDEVLAVGDASFQKRCLGKMDDVAREGRTILFVSHNMGAVGRICQRAVWLDHGTVKQVGDAGDVVAAYMGQGEQSRSRVTFKLDPQRPGQVTTLEVLDAQGNPSERHLADQPITIRVCYSLRQALRQYRVGVVLRGQDGLDVYTSASTDADGRLWDDEPGNYAADLALPAGLLRSGRYTLSPFLHQPRKKLHDNLHNALTFDVQGSARALPDGHWPAGVIGLPLPWVARKAA